MNTTQTEPKCEDKVNAAADGRLMAIDALLNPTTDKLLKTGYDDIARIMDESEERGRDEAAQYFSEYGLAFDFVEAGTFEAQTTGYFRFQISYGGPSEEIRFYTDIQGNLDRAEFWYLDWFEGACIDITHRPHLRALYDYFSEGGLFTIPSEGY